MNQTHQALHIGLTGPMGAGKGEIVRLAVELGFRTISLSDMVHAEGRRRYGTPSRQQLQDTGNDLRRQGGPGILGKMVAKEIAGQPPAHWLIDSIRNPAEIVELRRLTPFFLLGVDADRRILLQRLRDRRRNDDLADEEELQRRLDREWGIGEPENGQQVGPCLTMTDETLHNNGSLEELRTAALRFLHSRMGG